MRRRYRERGGVWLDERSANADVEIFNAGKYETAAALLRDRILLVPGTDFSRVLLASALGHLGEGDEARRIWQELEQINPKYSFSEHFARQPFKKEEDVQRIAEGLAKAGLST
jgi:adenylate cyclase